ncbi:hypothetical protein GGU10DRAFT_279536 [Lentinula aff. detonsa]|uniref:Uncharacterized protein n=1 Tax=Lentinula aff. detonsa TaxID=2804958 RepID=A0AA38NJ77_9AGAR|nr:hypothetical protein GGU10DRAFT_279536 [Lentinula aff. detonsa]
MNSVNASTGLSMFQLRYGRSPRVIPPLLPTVGKRPGPDTDPKEAAAFLDRLVLTEKEARDNLYCAKVLQSYHADKSRGPCEIFQVGDLVLLSTLHRRQAYKKAGEK